MFAGHVKSLFSHFCDEHTVPASPEHIRLVVTTDCDNYVQDLNAIFNCMGSILGKTFDTNEDIRTFHTTFTSPFFRRNRARLSQVMRRHAHKLSFRFASKMKAGLQANYEELFHHYILYNTMGILFGSIHDPDSGGMIISDKRLFSVEFAEALVELQKVVAKREAFGSIWPLYELIGDKAKHPLRIITAQLDPIIQQALDEKKLMRVGVISNNTTVDLETEDESQLDYIISLTDDIELIKSAILSTLIASRMVSSSHLLKIFQRLAQDGRIMARVKQEIKNVVRSNKTPPERVELQELKYLRAVINETLRLEPKMQYITWTSVHATTWPPSDLGERLVYIPQGSRITLDINTLHSSKDLWGPDAEQFDPDRFLDYRVDKYCAANPNIFIPWSLGAKICPGNEFMYDQTSIIVVELLHHFDDISLVLDSNNISLQEPSC